MEVSTWVTVMSLYFFSLSAFSISGSCGREPMGARSWVAGDVVGGEAVGEGVGEVTGVEDEDGVGGFGKIGGDEVPA